MKVLSSVIAVVAGVAGDGNGGAVSPGAYCCPIEA